MISLCLSLSILLSLSTLCLCLSLADEQKLFDEESIFYVNAIESAVSAMEVSAIGAKNVALLCCRDLGC